MKFSYILPFTDFSPIRFFALCTAFSFPSNVFRWFLHGYDYTNTSAHLYAGMKRRRQWHR